jgi:hypothetical protein
MSITQTVCVFVTLGSRHWHAPYYHLWPSPFCNIFPHYLINDTILEKKVTTYLMCVLISSTTFV